jgi:hypothetical protein
MGGLVLATATPLFFYGVTVWEHSLTVALPLSAVVVLRRISRARLQVAGFLAGSACWFREELSVMLLALAIACSMERRRIADGVIFSLGAVPAILGLLAFNWLIFGEPLGLHVAGSVGGSRWASGFAFELSAAGLGHFLALIGAQLSALGANQLEALLFSLALVAIALLGMTTLRRRTAGPVPLALTLTLGVGTWLWGTIRIFLGGWPMLKLAFYNGLLLQLPLFCLVVMGTAAIWQNPKNAPLRLGVMAGLLFLAIEVAFRATTELFTGGQWGPRELLPAVPAVVAAAWAAMQTDSIIDTDNDGTSDTRAPGATLLRWGGVALISAGLLSTIFSIWLLVQQKQEAEKLQDMILSAPTNVVLTTKPILAAHLATIFDQQAMMLLKDEPSLSRIAGNLRAHDVEKVLLVTPRGARQPPGCSPWARHRGRFVHYSDSDLFTCSPSAMTTAVP